MYHSIRTADDEVEAYLRHLANDHHTEITSRFVGTWTPKGQLESQKELLEAITVQLDQGNYFRACLMISVLWMILTNTNPDRKIDADSILGFMNMALSIEQAKNVDYAQGGGHKFYNFEQVSQIFSKRTPFEISTEHGFQFYIALKEVRSYTVFWNMKYGVPIQHESAADSALDLFNYIKLLLKWALWRDIPVTG